MGSAEAGCERVALRMIAVPPLPCRRCPLIAEGLSRLGPGPPLVSALGPMPGGISRREGVVAGEMAPGAAVRSVPFMNSG